MFTVTRESNGKKLWGEVPQRLEVCHLNYVYVQTAAMRVNFALSLGILDYVFSLDQIIAIKSLKIPLEYDAK